MKIYTSCKYGSVSFWMSSSRSSSGRVSKGSVNSSIDLPSAQHRIHIPNKKLRLWVQDLRNQCLQHGRHDNINMLCTTHQLMNYKETKILLVEATKVVFFPNSGGAAQIKRFLKTYGELDAKQIQDVFKIKSRWVMLNKAAPRFILHASGCYML